MRGIAPRVASRFRGLLSAFHGLSRDAKILTLAGGLFSFPFGVIAVALPIYLKRLLYPEIVIGSFFSGVGVIAVLLAIPFGIVADRFGRKRLAIAGSGLHAIAFLLQPLAGDVAVLYGIAVLAGVSEALVFATLQALLADASTEENRTTVFSLSFFTQSAAIAIGSLAASAPDLLVRAGWGVVPAYAPLFVATAAAFASAGVLFSRISRPDLPHGSRSILPRTSRRTIGKFLAVNLIFGLGAGLIIPIFSLWFFLKFAQTESFTGPLFAVGAAVNAFSSLAAPVLARRYGMVWSITALSAVAALLLFSMALTPWLSLAAVLYLARNATQNASWPVLSAFLMGVVGPAERASASAIVGVSFRLPYSLTTAFGAAMMAQQPDLPLLVTTAIYAVGTTSFFAFFRGVPEARAAAAANAGR